MTRPIEIDEATVVKVAKDLGRLARLQEAAMKTDGEQRTIKLACRGGGPLPIIRPDDFLRTRMKSGSRFYLVADAETHPPKTSRGVPRIHVLVYTCTRQDWERRDPEQVTHWYRHDYRKQHGRRAKAEDPH